MTKKIFKSIFTVTLVILIACFAIITGVLYEHFTDLQTEQLRNELSLISRAVELNGTEYLKDLDSGCRITLIKSDGEVIYDSEVDASTMENHSDRKEVKEAVANGFGESKRYSSTLTEKTLYYAEKLTNGNIVRVSVSSATVLTLLLSMLQPTLVLLVLAVALCAYLANTLSKKIVEPINTLNLDRPLEENDAYDEIAPILTHIEQQRRQIRNQREELEKRERDFYAVIENMREGLVLLDNKGTVLSINPAASSFFSTDKSCIGKDFLTIERNHEINNTISHALETGQADIRIEKLGKTYQINVGRIQENDDICGVVILIFDVSDKIAGENIRKEFTANVSHELKTPLQAIVGSAELLDNELVKESDKHRFIGHIKNEGERLINLIDDIIRLSQLDEGENIVSEETDLFEIAKEEIENLKITAEENDIKLNLTGKSTSVNGVPGLLKEIVFNLCENAIKYNRPGGSVDVYVSKEDSHSVLTVKDTGIGIPEGEKDRIFERFYRVDKSHSKETGGTGLGLSIVKHAVQYMGGSIQVESELGKGTTISVFFK